MDPGDWCATDVGTKGETTRAEKWATQTLEIPRVRGEQFWPFVQNTKLNFVQKYKLNYEIKIGPTLWRILLLAYVSNLYCLAFLRIQKSFCWKAVVTFCCIISFLIFCILLHFNLCSASSFIFCILLFILGIILHLFEDEDVDLFVLFNGCHILLQSVFLVCEFFNLKIAWENEEGVDLFVLFSSCQPPPVGQSFVTSSCLVPETDHDDKDDDEPDDDDHDDDADQNTRFMKNDDEDNGRIIRMIILNGPTNRQTRDNVFKKFGMICGIRKELFGWCGNLKICGKHPH